jgi:hypothetical protein
MRISFIPSVHSALSPEGAGSGSASPAPGAPSSSPSSAPAGGDSSSGAPTPATPDSDLDFAAIFGSDDGSPAPSADEVPPAAPAAPAPPQPSVQPEPAPARAEPAAVAEVGAAPEPQAPAPVGTPDQGQPPAAPPAALDPYDPAALAGHLAASEAAAIEFVAKEMFQLSDSEREALEQDVIGTVPKLLARVFVKSQQNVLNQLGRIIPTMIQRHTEAMRANDMGVERFYARWKDLDRSKHNEIATKYATVYRHMHPNATLEQMIEDLGPMVMMAARVVPSTGAPAVAMGQAAGEPPGQRPGVAAAPQPPAPNGRRPPPSPFTPAGAGPTAQSRAPEKEAWEAMFDHPG